MRITRERQGQPDRSRAGTSRNLPVRTAEDNPRKGKPDRSHAGEHRPPDPIQTLRIRRDELRATDAGINMIQSDDVAGQRTLLEFTTVGTSMVKAADVAAQRTLLEFTSDGTSMVKAADVAAQRTLLEFTTAGTSMVKAANVAAQRTLLEYGSTGAGKGASLIGVAAGPTNVEAALTSLGTGVAGKQPLDATLTALASAGIGDNQFLVGTGTDAFAKTTISDFAITILDDAAAGDVRTTISAQALDATLTALAGLSTSANQVAYSTGSDAFSMTSLTAFARTLIDDATAEAARQTLEVGNTEQHSVWWQDYLIPSASALGWSSDSASGGSGQSWEAISDASNATGVFELRTGTSRTGRYSLLSWNNALVFNNETAYTFEARVNIQALSTGSEEYNVTFGFGNSFDEASAHTDETDYAFWIYRRTVDGDFWVAATAKDGTETKTVTSTAPVGNDTTFVVLKIVVPADGSSVTYYIDGVEKAEHESNVPAVTDRMGIGLRIDKTVGTTQREFRIDWHRFTTTRTAAR